MPGLRLGRFSTLLEKSSSWNRRTLASRCETSRPPNTTSILERASRLNGIIGNVVRFRQATNGFAMLPTKAPLMVTASWSGSHEIASILGRKVNNKGNVVCKAIIRSRVREFVHSFDTASAKRRLNVQLCICCDSRKHCSEYKSLTPFHCRYHSWQSLSGLEWG